MLVPLSAEARPYNCHTRGGEQWAYSYCHYGTGEHRVVAGLAYDGSSSTAAVAHGPWRSRLRGSFAYAPAEMHVVWRSIERRD